MKIGRFQHGDPAIRIGLLADGSTVLDLTPAGITQLEQVLEAADPVAFLREVTKPDLPRREVKSIRWCAPVERQEVWAAGVTYLRSKTARMEESDFSATAYDRVYAAARPEIFFKSPAVSTSWPGISSAARSSRTAPCC